MTLVGYILRLVRLSLAVIAQAVFTDQVRYSTQALGKIFINTVRGFFGGVFGRPTMHAEYQQAA